MKKLALLLALAALAVPAAASAETSTVNAFACASIHGGAVTVPAGTQVVVTEGWATKSLGLTQDFLKAQTTTISVNGGPALDVSGFWGPPESHPLAWETSFSYPTGIVLGTGESLTFTVTTSISHRLLDGLFFASGTGGKPLFSDPGTLFEFSCTVTGA